MNLHPYAIEVGNSKEKGAVFKDMPITDDDVVEICKNTRLVNLTLEGTKITDKALEYLATLPNLGCLWLADTQITGAGFAHFAEHKKLETIGLENTKLNDDTLKIIAQLPKVNTLLIEGTQVTFEGMLAVAGNKKLRLIARTQFSEEQIKTFEQTQRDLAKKKPTATLSDENKQNATNHLLAFFKAMGEWELFAQTCTEKAERDAKVKALYQIYATEKWHDDPRYSYSMMPGGTYGRHQVVDYEVISKNRLRIYTDRDVGAGVDFHFRFLLIRQKDNSWRIDGVQQHFGNWEKAYL